MKKNNRTAIGINLLAAAVIVPLLVIGLVFKPIGQAYAAMESGKAWLLLFLPLIILIGISLYTMLREVIHALLIKYVGKSSPAFGFYGPYLYAYGDQPICTRKTYLILSLTPSAVLFLLMILLNILLPDVAFWPVYFIQMINLAGVVGDLYIAYLIRQMPSDLLVEDTGVTISFYTKEDFKKPLPSLHFVYRAVVKIRRKVSPVVKRFVQKISNGIKRLISSIKSKK